MAALDAVSDARVDLLARRVLAWLFTGFMVAILSFSFGMVIYRMPMLRARTNELDSWVSREAAFLINNWILLFSAFFVLFATMFPTLSEAITGTRLTVAAPFYTKWMVPVGLILMFLTGVGPLLAWRKSTGSAMRDQFMWPTAAGVVTLVAMKALGLGIWSSGLCFALCAFVGGTIAQEFWRGVRIRRKNTGTDALTALVGLVSRNKRRYGGYVVHLGIVLVALGFAGNSYKVDEQFAVKLGEEVTVGKYTLKNDGIKVSDDGQKQMTTAYISVYQNGKQIDSLFPARWVFRHHEEAPTTEVGIRRTFAEDLYVVMPSNDPSTMASQTAPLQIVINPLVNWIWLGFGVLAFGTGIALLPERALSFATARASSEAAATAGLLLLMLMLPSTLFAQPGMPSVPAGVDTQTSYYPRSEFEKQLQHEIVCTCGCGHITIAECRKDPCAVSHEMRGTVARLIDEGKNHDEIITAMVTKYGSEEMIGAPLDKGFRRLSWVLPWTVGVAAAGAVGFVAIRWSKQRQPDALDASAPLDQDTNDRLDDELRNLD